MRPELSQISRLGNVLNVKEPKAAKEYLNWKVKEAVLLSNTINTYYFNDITRYSSISLLSFPSSQIFLD